MARDQDEVGVRLQRAALELFRDRGYERTTAAEIAARAGVTERTFFRYFVDKREVLFGGAEQLQAALATSITGAPAGLSPIDTLFRAFRSVEALLEANRPFSEPRHAVIASTPALYERELAKIAALTDALGAALNARGVGALQATLAARTGMAAFVQATVAWLDDPAVALGRRLDRAERGLKALLSASTSPSTPSDKRRNAAAKRRADP